MHLHIRGEIKWRIMKAMMHIQTEEECNTRPGSGIEITAVKGI
jgi:hypothetical protein